MTGLAGLHVSWPLGRLKHFVDFQSGGTPSVERSEYWAEGDGIPWVTIADMTRGFRVTRTGRTLTDAGLRALRSQPSPDGTVLYAMYASVGKVAILATPAVWNQAIIGMTPHLDRAEVRFLAYWLAALQPAILALTRSNTQDNLSGEQVANFPFPAIPVRRQRSIADFLDRETARIDALIRSKGQLLEHLVERRRSIVFHGVAGRLGGNQAFHEAGLPWVRQVGAPWPAVKIKHVARLGTGHTPSRLQPELWENPTIPWITTGEIQQVRDDRREVIIETREKISERGLANSAAELHPACTVVLCRTASAGYSAIMGADMATSQDFATWTCSDRLLPRYLLMCLRAMRRDLQQRLAFGSTHKTIYMPDIEELKIPLPSIAEQQEILDAIDSRTQKVDQLSELLDGQISLLAEHRQALITASVTGAIDVAERTR